jgi:TetR/AcrR family transcriptional regulator, transcriptional repressor for nem operon
MVYYFLVRSSHSGGKAAYMRINSPVGRSRKGAKTRQHIVVQAAPLFNQRGYEGCSLSEIMAATGIEKGGIYRHFANKEELALAAFDFAWKEVSHGRTRGLEEIKDPLLRIEAFIRNFVDRRPALRGGCPLLNTAIDTDDGNLALRACARQALNSWRMRLTSLIHSAVRRGTLNPETQSRIVASIIIGTLEGALMMSRLDEDRCALEIARDHLISYMESLRVKKRTGRGSGVQTLRK